MGVVRATTNGAAFTDLVYPLREVPGADKSVFRRKIGIERCILHIARNRPRRALAQDADYTFIWISSEWQTIRSEV